MYIKDLDIESLEKTERLGNRLWVLTKSFHFSFWSQSYRIPKGFVTDGASCPRVLWNVCAPVAGPFGQGAIIHDWFYNEGPDIPKVLADSLLYTAGRQRGANWFRAQLVYWGVRIGGEFSYKKGTSLDKLTEKSCYDYNAAVEIVKKLRGDHYVD